MLPLPPHATPDVGPCDPDPRFGPLLAERPPTLLTWALVLACLVLAAGGVALPQLRVRAWLLPWTVPLAYPPPRGAPNPPDPDFMTFALIGGAIALCFGVLALLTARSGLTRTRFYTLGVRTFLLGRPRLSLDYGRCTGFTYREVEHRWKGGLLQETRVTVILRPATGRTLRWIGVYPRSGQVLNWLGLGRGGGDTLAAIRRARAAIADAIADGWIDRIHVCETAPWSPGLEFRAQGLAAVRGRRKGELLPFEQMPDLYDAHDLYLIGNDIDNMPAAVTESCATGIALVTTNAGGIPYLVKHEESALIVNCGDYAGLAREAMRLLQDPELARRLAHNARRNAQQFTWETVRDQWLQLYQSLTRESTSSLGKSGEVWGSLEKS